MSEAPALPGASALVHPREQSLFVLLLIFSVSIWLLLALSIVGLFYALLLGVAAWFGAGLLAAQLRSEAVEVTPSQMPELHTALLEVCRTLGQAVVPRLYVLQAGGALNAFAMRHSGRNFVAVFSDMLEAYGADTPEMRFVLGHEVGHIRRNHILRFLALFPGLMFPLVGPAYRRACELTCDRFGMAACGDAQAAATAMMILTGGKYAGRAMSPEVFAAQHRSERGFFVSWHELTSWYPTLSRRVTELLAAGAGATPTPVGRHPLAYRFATLTPGIGGGGAGALVAVAVVAMLAVIAVPSFLRARERALERQATHAEVPSESAGSVGTEPGSEQ